jgi:hypothetical protein
MEHKQLNSRLSMQSMKILFMTLVQLNTRIGLNQNRQNKIHCGVSEKKMHLHVHFTISLLATTKSTSNTKALDTVTQIFILVLR